MFATPRCRPTFAAQRVTGLRLAERVGAEGVTRHLFKSNGGLRLRLQSALRASRPAASHATIQPRLSSQSGSTLHERDRHVSHPHRQARFLLVTIRPRQRSTGQLPGRAFNRAILPESLRHRGSSESETHQRPPSPDGRALASCVRRQRRDQIAIAPASPSAPHLPQVPSLEAFGRRPRRKPNRRDGPSSETLHIRDRDRPALGLTMSATPQPRPTPAVR
jgi:hypothetical protein